MFKKKVIYTYAILHRLDGKYRAGVGPEYAFLNFYFLHVMYGKKNN